MPAAGNVIWTQLAIEIMQNPYVPTEIIRAAHHFTIELGATSWRLLNGARDPGSPAEAAPLFEAYPTHLVTAPAFARARHLPGDGHLSPQDVVRVVVGWAPESRNWHLGLLLATGGSRPQWCGLATWPSGQPADFAGPAQQAGQALAHLINRPFQIVPAPAPAIPYPEPVPPPAVDPLAVPLAAPDIAPHTPPFTFDAWTLLRVPRGYVWQRRARWLWNLVLRTLGLGVLTIFFVIMGTGAQNSGLASVNPSWLPAVGLVVALVIALNAVQNLWTLLNATDVLVDIHRREVRSQGRFLPRVRWQMPLDAIQYVLLSQTPSRAQGRKEAHQPMRTVQEVWLHVYDGRDFREVAALGQVEGQSENWDATRHAQKKKGRRQFWLRDYDTPAHHAARVMAEALNTDLWLDIR
jgi:hypothetical protein